MNGAHVESENRRRGRRKALRLCEEQSEKHFLRLALRWIDKLENKIQSQEHRNSSGERTRKKGKVPEHRDLGNLSVLGGLKKQERKTVKPIIDAVVFKIRFGLKRYHLRKRATSRWEVRCSRKEFLALFGGFEDIKEHRLSKNLFVVIQESTANATLQKLAEILDFQPADRNWFSRRYYGPPNAQKRDCSFVHINPAHEVKGNIRFGWKEKRVGDVDHKGTERINKLGFMFMLFPRGVTVFAKKK